MNGTARILAVLSQELSFVFTTEYKFHEARKWRIDFAICDLKIAIERDGMFIKNSKGKWIPGGRHIHPKGFSDDVEKLNMLSISGWVVIRTTPVTERDGRAESDIKRAVVIAKNIKSNLNNPMGY